MWVISSQIFAGAFVVPAQVSRKAGAWFTVARALLLSAACGCSRVASQIFTEVGLPDTLTCIRVERLRFLGQLARHASDTVWAVARADCGFVEAQRDALTWMFEVLHATVAMPNPLENWLCWARLCQERPQKWKGWLKRAAELQMRRTQLPAALEATKKAI